MCGHEDSPRPGTRWAKHSAATKGTIVLGDPPERSGLNQFVKKEKIGVLLGYPLQLKRRDLTTGYATGRTNPAQPVGRNMWAMSGYHRYMSLLPSNPGRAPLSLLGTAACQGRGTLPWRPSKEHPKLLILKTHTHTSQPD